VESGSFVSLGWAREPDFHHRIPINHLEVRILRPSHAFHVSENNRIAQNAGWNAAMLNLELAELSFLAADLSVLGFSEKELAAALSAHAPGLTDEDQVPALADIAVSQKGTSGAWAPTG
jgi:hypothetical protein